MSLDCIIFSLLLDLMCSMYNNMLYRLVAEEHQAVPCSLGV